MVRYALLLVASAAAVLAVAVGRADDDATDPYSRAKAAFIAGDYRAAVDGFRAAVEGRPDWASGHLILGQCEWLLGNAEQGEREMAAAGELDPQTDLAGAYMAVGRTLYGQARYAESVRPFELALDLASEPLRDEASLRVADALLLAGRFADARTAFERHLRLDPADRRATWRLALACRKLEDYPCALDTGRRARDMAGEDPGGIAVPRSVAQWAYTWATLADSTGRREFLLRQAVGDTDIWLAAAPGDDDARRLDGEALLALGDEARVLERFEGPAELDAGDCVGALLVARALNRSDDRGVAERWARRAVDCDPHSADAWLALGSSLLAELHPVVESADDARTDRDRAAQAREALARAIALDPQSRAQAMLGDTETTLARLDEAVAEFDTRMRDDDALRQREREREVLERCRVLEWRRRDESKGLTEEQRSYYDEHDCRTRTASPAH